MHNKRKIDNPADPTRPTLRRAPGSSGGTVGSDEDGKDYQHPMMKTVRL